MTPLPLPPPEPKRQHSLDVLAPKVQIAVRAVLADMEAAGFRPLVFETLRSDERQAWLYGFGRAWDDAQPRGVVTKLQTAGWHRYGLACDIVENDATPWDATPDFWQALGDSAKRNGLKWGGDWRSKDLPHVQHGSCRISPSNRSSILYDAGGYEAVWREVGAL